MSMTMKDDIKYLWYSKIGCMNVSEAKRIKELETENARLKKLLAETMLEDEIAKEAVRKKWSTSHAANVGRR